MQIFSVVVGRVSVIILIIEERIASGGVVTVVCGDKVKGSGSGSSGGDFFIQLRCVGYWAAAAGLLGCF